MSTIARSVQNNVQLGATLDAGGVQFRVWAPDAKSVSVIFESPEHTPLELQGEVDGYFVGHASFANAGTVYRYRLNGGHRYPDPYSRFQPDGPHGPSMVMDPAAFAWRDASWQGLDPERQVIYELHVGTFTREGTYAAAARQFAGLKALGITSVELMPVNEFVGAFGWGYDGVNWFAPYHHYGRPDDLKALVDHAHAVGLGVILDVVYNHFGADGNYLSHFAREYFAEGNENPWGATINYACEPVRRLAIDNAAYWIREFHLDGLRLDATQNIHDPDHPTLLRNLVREARLAAGSRRLVISGEDYLQRTSLLAPDPGAGLNQVWNDDFHHSSRVALTGNRWGYFAGYRGDARELLAALRSGYLYQGQYDAWVKGPRGEPVTDEPRSCFIAFTQNHDQVANTLHGARIHSLTSPGKLRAMTAVLLLGPHTPLLFMGQEFSASSPFAYFADYEGKVADELWKNRKGEFQGFEQYMDPLAQATLLDPCSRMTVERSTLELAERETARSTVDLYGDLLRLRRDDAVLRARPLSDFDGAVISEQCFVVRWHGHNGNHRLLAVNFGAHTDSRAIAEPLLAPPAGRRWRLAWSSDSPRYGGLGSVMPCGPNGWSLAAESASFLVADPC